MSYRTAFWILILLTVISAVLQMLGYNFLEVLIILLIIDSIGFGSMIEIEKRKSQREVETSKIVTQKIEGLEKICQDVFQKVSTSPAAANMEERLKSHKEERNKMMEKISRKTLELEQKINKFGARLAEHLEEFEKNEKKEEGESFSLGELVYLNEDEEKA